MTTDTRAQPPFAPPDCPWLPMNSNAPLPEEVVYQNAELDGVPAYIGRVYDGTCLYIGTALPSKNICFYLDKDLVLKSSSSYEILTCPVGVPLYFSELDFEDKNIFAGGVDDDETLYIGRHIDGDDSYYGWIKKSTNSMYVPRDPKKGPVKIDKDFDIMIHRFADRICICPPCPYPPGSR